MSIIKLYSFSPINKWKQGKTAWFRTFINIYSYHKLWYSTTVNPPHTWTLDDEDVEEHYGHVIGLADNDNADASGIVISFTEVSGILISSVSLQNSYGFYPEKLPGETTTKYRLRLIDEGIYAYTITSIVEDEYVWLVPVELPFEMPAGKYYLKYYISEI